MIPMAEAAKKIEPLNPILYSLLKHKFSDVTVANQGTPAVVESVYDPIRRRTLKRIICSGEYYCINCPFCNDMGNKLWINHTYGVDHNEATGRRRDTHLAYCYKNECLKKDTGKYTQLEDMIFGDSRRFLKKLALRPVVGEFVAQAIVPPGQVIMFTDLPDYHPAAEYLVQRNFDPVELSGDFAVGVCVEPDNPRYNLMRGRIYIPVIFNKQLAGWQGRTINEHSKPKYYNSPGMQKSRTLYNYDRAAEMPAVVVVEGVPSVWRIGAAGVCIFGKTLSAWQCNTIATTWAGKPVFFMLDSDAQKEIDAGVTELCRHGVNVVPVILPDVRDPADYTRAELRQILADAADAVSVSVDMSFMD